MALLLDACATASGGHIPPSAFEFHEIVSNEGPLPGGWKVAQVNILLARVSRYKPLQAWCDLEIGIPLENWKRSLTDSLAQRKSAQASDAAAQLVLRGNETVSVLACNQFRDETRRLLERSLFGVRVTKFLTLGIEPKSFPED
ncbi:hypothetical protein JRI60_12570 [Archangium violaceum]|uniref:hypothetical protein n=1 Tax=Archangium violaceum TaxID=83451 RepID=UPI00194EEBBD|nr:hypothetical protein [Archangium violaceum]QRN99794.1 hypothetical protein JRI60_12570 [Archangium violaceum]